jgi:hypothetical protein
MVIDLPTLHTLSSLSTANLHDPSKSVASFMHAYFSFRGGHSFITSAPVPSLAHPQACHEFQSCTPFCYAMRCYADAFVIFLVSWMLMLCVLIFPGYLSVFLNVRTLSSFPMCHSNPSLPHTILFHHVTTASFLSNPFHSLIIS